MSELRAPGRRGMSALWGAAWLVLGTAQAATTYQGELREGGQPANGPYDVQFCLFAEAGGGTSLACHEANDLPVVAGRFSATLAFDASHFPGAVRYVELRVRAGASSAPHTVLAPRQALTPTPYAHTALNVAAGAIGSAQLAAQAVTTSRIAAGAVGGAQIADASITAADVADAALGVAKVDTSQVQARVSGACPAGQSIRAIHADGSVDCGAGAVGGGFEGVLDAAGNQGLSTALALGTNGLPIVSYYDGDSGALKIARCNDAACQDVSRRTLFTPGEMLDPVDGPHLGTAIAIGAGGRPLIAFLDLTDQSLRLIRCGDALCDGTLSIVTLAPNGALPSLAIGADGHAVVAAVDGLDLMVVKCSDAACASSTLRRPYSTTAGHSLGNTSIVANGLNPFVSLWRYDGTRGRVLAVACSDAACTTATSTFLTASEGDALVPDVARYAFGGLPVVAYFDRVDTTLKAAFCSNAACTAAIHRTIDGSPLRGLWPSLAVDAAGNPVFAYLVNGVGVYLATCSSPDCGSPIAIVPIDVPGRHLSLALRADGSPVVSHYDEQAQDLRLVLCADATCP